MSDYELDKAVEDGLDAFWGAIMANYPAAKTGDLSPDTIRSLQGAAETAVSEWVENNVPKKSVSPRLG